MEQILSFMIDNRKKKSLATTEINFEFSLNNWFSDVPLFQLEIAQVIQHELQRLDFPQKGWLWPKVFLVLPGPAFDQL